MNLTLILTTILTSAADSLNPVAITQQFVLQGMVKQRCHIWYFICATYATNFIGGIMVYYGLFETLLTLWNSISSGLESGIYVAELIGGIVLFCFSIHKIIMLCLKSRQAPPSNEKSQEAAIQSKIKSVSPASLFFLGIIATIMELTSAFPYFAFLGILLNYHLSFAEVFCIQALYNLIYALPLMLLYFIYCKKQSLFDWIYSWVKQKMNKLSLFVTPTIFTALSVILVFHSIKLLF